MLGCVRSEICWVRTMRKAGCQQMGQSRGTILYAPLHHPIASTQVLDEWFESFVALMFFYLGTLMVFACSPQPQPLRA